MQADTGDLSQYDVLVQPQIIPTIRSMARGNDTHTHILIQQDNQEAQGKSHGTTLGQSNPNVVSLTLDHVRPTMGRV